MTNMSYCRFRNTLNDLQVCAEHMSDELGREEHNARVELIETMIDILADLLVGIDSEALDNNPVMDRK